MWIGHTLAEVLEQVAILTDHAPSRVVVGPQVLISVGPQVLISGTRRGLTPTLAKLLRRRSSIEPEIGHMNTDGRLARCALKGALGDAVSPVAAATTSARSSPTSGPLPRHRGDDPCDHHAATGQKNPLRGGMTTLFRANYCSDLLNGISSAEWSEV